MRNIPFEASRNTTNTIASCYNSALMYGDAGITLDGSIVTTTECVDYRLKRNGLIMRFKNINGKVKITYYNSIENQLEQDPALSALHSEKVLSTQAYTILKRQLGPYATIHDVAKYAKNDDLRKIRNMGPVTLENIKHALRLFNY